MCVRNMSPILHRHCSLFNFWYSWKSFFSQTQILTSAGCCYWLVCVRMSCLRDNDDRFLYLWNIYQHIYNLNHKVFQFYLRLQSSQVITVNRHNVCLIEINRFQIFFSLHRLTCCFQNLRLIFNFDVFCLVWTDDFEKNHRKNLIDNC